MHSDLPFFPERMEINKCSKPGCSLYDKNNYIAHIRSLKQELDHGLILKKVHRVHKIELGGKIITKFVAPRSKACSCLMDDDSEAKKAKETKKNGNKKNA